LKAVEKVLNHSYFILGSESEKFEKKFAEYCNTKYAIGLNSGTDALYLTLIALNIGKGDEVITVPNSFLATVAIIKHCGAKPILTDVGNDLNLDTEILEKKITKKTKAIIPVHLTGKPATMNIITKIAKKHKLYVIEDAAQAIGAEFDNKRVGSFGIAGCFSLHPLKNLNACGDAGIVTTNNKKLYEKLILLRNHGLKNRDEAVLWGYNSRLDTMQAAILLEKMKHLDKWTEKIRKIAHFYSKNLKNLPIALPLEKKKEKCVYHTYIIQTQKRDQLKKYLQNKGISTKIHYPIPIHLQQAARFLDYKKGSFPIAEKQANTILSLPIYPELTKKELVYIIKTIKNFYEKK